MTDNIKIWFSDFRWLMIALFTAYLILQFNTMQPYILALFCVLIITRGISRYWDNTMTGMIVFTIVYYTIRIFNGHNASPVIWFIEILAPFTLYSFGKNIVRNCGCGKPLLLFIFLITFAITIKYIIATISMISQGSIMSVDRLLDFGDTTEDLSQIGATYYACLVAPGLVGVSAFISSFKENKFLSILFFALFILTLIVNVNLLNRTALAVSALLIILAIIYGSDGIQMKRTVIPILVLIFVVFLIFNFTDSYNIFIESYTYRSERDIGAGGGRVDIWKTSLTNLLKYPFGWSNIAVQSWSHNLWLDIARDAGIIPFIVFIMVSINALKPIKQLYKIKKDSSIALVLGLNLVMFCYAFVEPLISVRTSYFFMFFVWGITRELMEIKKVN